MICFDRLLDQRSEFDALEIEDRFARFHFFDIQNVVEQANEPLAVRVCDREQLRGGFRQLSGRVAGEKTERAGDRSERGAQLVAHRGDEFVFQSVLFLVGRDRRDPHGIIGTDIQIADDCVRLSSRSAVIDRMGRKAAAVLADVVQVVLVRDSARGLVNQ